MGRSGGDLTVAMRVQADVASGVKSLAQIETGFSNIDKAAAAAAVAANRAGEVLDKSFGTLGIRSVAEIQREIKSLEQAYESLRTSAWASTEDIGRAELALQQRVAALNAEMGRTPQHIKSGNAAIATGTQQLNKYGVSAGQTAQAMRQLPMQITDIVTGLASGQSPFLVAIQQGGQLKDSFGGIVPAARALLGAISPTVVAVGALGGTAAAAVAGLYQASEASNDLARAVELTGNRAGVTSGQIADLARVAAAASGQTIGTAQEIATSLVATGEFGGKVLTQLTTLIADFAKKTGQDVAKVSPALQKAFSDPAKGATELNKVMNFLSYEQLKYIDTLQKQGRLEEAQLALADALGSKLQTMQVHLNGVTGWWDKLATSAKNAWHEMFAPTSDTEKLANLQRNLAAWQESANQAESGSAMEKGARARIAAIQAEITALTQKGQTDKAAAAADEKKAAQNKAHIEAMTAIEKLEESVKTKTQQRTEAIQNLNAQLKSGDINPAEYQRGLTAINKKFEDKTAVSAAGKIDNAYAQQQLSLTKEIEASKRRLAAAAAGVTVEEGRARDNLDAWLELNKTALKLQPQQVANLRQMADEADRLAKATADASYVQGLKKKASTVGQTEEKALALEIDSKNLDPQAKAEAQAAANDYVAKKDAESLKQINRQYLEASGNIVAAQAAAAEAQYGELITRLTARGDEAGLKIVQGLINIQATKTQLDALQTEIDKALARQSAGENTLQTQVAAGALSQGEAQQKLLDLHRATALEIDALLPKMQALAEATGDPKAVSNVAALRLQVAQLKNEASQLETAFKGAFTSSMATALSDLASGTKSLGESVQGFIHGLATSMAQFASQQIADMAWSGMKKAVSGVVSAMDTASKTASTVKTVSDTASTVNTVASATKVAADTADTTATTAAATAATALATSFTAATVTVDVSMTSFAAAALAADTLTAALIAAASAAAASATTDTIGSVAKAAAATGGYISGPGTGTSDSIDARLSNGEFVTRAAVVAQPGAKEFLHAFNTHGMRVVQHFAEGGLVSVAPTVAGTTPAYQLARASEIQSGPGNVSVNQRLLPVLDEDLLTDALKGPKGESLIFLHISRNPAKARSVLGIKG